MKKGILTISLLLSVSAMSWGITVTDDFNRADTAYSTDGADIGANWVNSDTNDLWKIEGNALQTDLITSPSILHNNTQQLGVSFVASIDTTTILSNKYAGLVFNYQNPTNYYVLRFKTGTKSIHLLSVVDNVNDTVLLQNTGAVFVEGTLYTITVSSDTAHEFDFTITETGSSAVLNTTTSFVDTNSNFTDGYAGVYATSGDAIYDNFSAGPPPPPPTEVFDDFNRADTTYSTDGATIGANWVNSDTDLWRIDGNTLQTELLSSPSILHNNALQLGDTFTMSMDVSTAISNTWGGIVFNYQNPTNYYVLRFKTNTKGIHLLSVVDNVNDTVALQNSPAVFDAGTMYTLTVTSDTLYDFDFTVTETGSSTLLNSTTNFVDASGNFTGGYAGAYATSGDVTYDNFSIQGPSGPTGYAGWSTTWGVDIGAETDDYDEDGLLNIYEYGLGGDPTDPANQGTSPEFSILDAGGSNVFSYVYPQLADPDSGLSYSLELNTDLVSGTWTNMGYTVAGTNDTGGELDFVTNLTDTVAGKKFIRLIIE